MSLTAKAAIAPMRANMPRRLAGTDVTKSSAEAPQTGRISPRREGQR
jgi:hypothetical protein